MLLLVISFIAGILTVLAPCILPLLPVIVGGSLGNEHRSSRKKTFTIIASLGISIILFTLLLKASTLFIEIPQNTWQWISGGIIIVFGFITLFPSLWQNKWTAKISAKSNIALGKGAMKDNFWGDVTIGAALGPVFSTCSPTYFIVLASVLPVSPALGMVYLLTYVIGLSLALLGVVFLGQKILTKLNIAGDPKSILKKVLGILFILVGIAVISGFDKDLQVKILDTGFLDVTKIEHKLLEIRDNNEQTKEIETKASNQVTNYMTIDEKKKEYNKIPEISTPDGFINTGGQPVTLRELQKQGKVVLLDIWTYSCINCQRTLPYLNDWYEKYADQGLEIVGLHTPEFAFEKVLANVQKAVDKFNIKYPVVLDNDYSTWRELGNQYWPRKYLVDIDGFIVYDHIGEGGYPETEKAIQQALKEKKLRDGMSADVPDGVISPEDAYDVNSSRVKSPEVYFGAWRNSILKNGEQGTEGEQNFQIPSSIIFNGLYLGGKWNIEHEYAENKEAGAHVVMNYQAKNVYMVAGSDSPVVVEVYQDDKLIKTITVSDEGLYELIEDEDYGQHTLHLLIKTPGIQIFTFTFG